LNEKIGEKIGAFYAKYSYFCSKMIIPLVFNKIAILGRKLVKIAENRDHNIGPLPPDVVNPLLPSVASGLKQSTRSVFKGDPIQRRRQHL
jgi:hypothetical protein